MLAMNRRIAELGKQDIPRDNDFLTDPRPPRQTEPEAPLPHALPRCQRASSPGNGQARGFKHPGILDRATHDLVILHAMAIVRYGDHPGRKHRPISAPTPLRRDPFVMAPAVKILISALHCAFSRIRAMVPHCLPPDWYWACTQHSKAASGGDARPVAMVSFCDWPGSSKVDVHINQTGATMRPVASRLLTPPIPRPAAGW